MNTRDLQPDMFEVVNGPEDGTDFPVTRTPVVISPRRTSSEGNLVVIHGSS